MKHLLGLPLWHLFIYAELAEVVRENDKLFINLLNKFRVGNIDDDVKNLIKANLYVNLIKTIQKMPCTCMQRMNQLRKGMQLF